MCGLWIIIIITVATEGEEMGHSLCAALCRRMLFGVNTKNS